MAFKRIVILRASFRFPAIRFDAPTLLSFSGFTHAHAKCPPVYITYKPAYSGATQVTEINTLDQISAEEVIDVSTHIPLKALMFPLKRVRSVV